MTVRKIFLIICFVVMLPGTSFSQTVTVAAAANLQPVFSKLKIAFEKENPLIVVEAVFGSSGKLMAQIENGAPFDIFLSADMKYPEVLYRDGFSLQPPRVYAYGVLVLWSVRESDLAKGMNILIDPRIRKIALADPQVSPFGSQAMKAIRYYKLSDAVENKIVLGESIGQVNDFISSASADVGFTSKSTVLSPDLKEKGVWVKIPLESYDRIAQGAVILKHAQALSEKGAQKFYDFLFSQNAKDVLKRSGYLVDE